MSNRTSAARLPLDGIRVVEFAHVIMDVRRFGARLDVPGVGEHWAELLRLPGYDDAAIAGSCSDGIIAAPPGERTP